MQQFGTTQDTFQEITEYHVAPDGGLKLFGSIKNIGATNDLTFRISVNDVYGQTDVITNNVKPGDAQSFTVLNENVGPNTTPPYTDVLLEVESTSAGNPTDWQYQDVSF